MNVIERIKKLKLIPVAVIEDKEDSLQLGNALIDAELPIVEITFRTAAAADSLNILKNELPELLLGAGTVLTIDQIKSAVKSGVDFIVTPGFNPTIVDYCIKNDINIIPGLNTPSFIEWGIERGLDTFKFFPANLSGGPAMLKVFSGPYPSVKFIPTGGVNSNNLIEYLKLNNVIACGGSWIVSKDLIFTKNFEEIKRRTKEAVDLIKKEFS